MIGNASYVLVPILLAALGGLMSERAGVLNIGLEGLMLLGAFGGVVGTAFTGSLVVGLITGALFSSLLALIYSVACLELRSNIFIAGLGVNLLAVGLIPYLSRLLFDTGGNIRIPDAPAFPTLLGLPITIYGAVLITALIHVVLNHTRLGIRIRAVGENESILASRGMRPRRYQRIAITLSGILAGLAGAEMALRLGVYVPRMSGNRGWIALVAVFLGTRRPFGVLAASALFAVLEALSGAAQGANNFSGTLLLALPYALTLVGIVVYSALARRRVE
jgi:simple sugar transport system permease protein